MSIGITHIVFGYLIWNLNQQQQKRSTWKSQTSTEDKETDQNTWNENFYTDLQVFLIDCDWECIAYTAHIYEPKTVYGEKKKIRDAVGKFIALITITVAILFLDVCIKRKESHSSSLNRNISRPTIALHTSLVFCEWLFFIHFYVSIVCSFPFVLFDEFDLLLVFFFSFYQECILIMSMCVCMYVKDFTRLFDTANTSHLEDELAKEFWAQTKEESHLNYEVEMWDTLCVCIKNQYQMSCYFYYFVFFSYHKFSTENSTYYRLKLPTSMIDSTLTSSFYSLLCEVWKRTSLSCFWFIAQ